MKHKPYKPTVSETEKIDHAGMVAAFAELSCIDDHDESVSLGVLACLKAFKAARKASYAAEKELLNSKPGYTSVSHYVEVTDLVCSAMFAHLIGIPPSECNSHSMGGLKIATLIKAAKALEAMDSIYSALDEDPGVLGTYMADEAVMYTSRMIGEGEENEPNIPD